MRNLPTSGTRGKSWSAQRRFQGWLAAWAQDRRRNRAQANDLPPLLVPGLKLYVRTESLAALANDTQVASWPDESGNDKHLAQATAANRPVYKVNVNGRPAVYFDGVNDVLATANSVLNPAQHTIFLVARPVGVNTNDAIGSGSTGNGDLLLMVGYANRMRGHIWRGANANTKDGTTFLLANVDAIFEQEVTATNLFLRLTGGAEATHVLGGAAANVSKPIYLGSRSNAWFFHGYVRALLVYEGNPSGADQTLIRNYLIATYGIPVPYPLPPAPGAPEELSGYYTGSSVALEWLTADQGIVLYVSVEKKTAGEPDANYWEAAQVSPGDNYYEDGDLVDPAYEYRVRSFGPGGFSPYSNSVLVEI